MVTAGVFEVPAGQDAVEFCYAQGWTDGLPVVPPTEDRVLRMLAGTRRPPGETVAWIPPRRGRATVERIAINAVMAGCRPEYMSVLMAAVEAMADPAFKADAEKAKLELNPKGGEEIQKIIAKIFTTPQAQRDALKKILGN